MSETARQRNSETAVKPNKQSVRTFHDLIAWQRAMELAEAVYQATKQLPESEKFGLTSQLRRAVISIPSNIAEGHARQTRADFLRLLRIARGSVAEVSTQFELARRLNLLQQDPQLQDLIAEVARILQALIRSLEAKERSE